MYSLHSSDIPLLYAFSRNSQLLFCINKIHFVYLYILINKITTIYIIYEYFIIHSHFSLPLVFFPGKDYTESAERNFSHTKRLFYEISDCKLYFKAHRLADGASCSRFCLSPDSQFYSDRSGSPSGMEAAPFE